MRYGLTAFLLISLLVASCSSSKRTRYARKMEVYGYDFTKYTEQGFLFTPESYQGEYRSVGTLQVIVWPEMTRRELSGETSPGAGKGGSYSDWQVETLTPQAAIDSLYQQAREMGADAVVRFDAKRVTESIQDGTRIGYQASGFAIDRKNK